MLQKPMPMFANERRTVGSSQEEWRTSTTIGYSLNRPASRDKYSRFSSLFLNEIGNCRSSAPRRRFVANTSRPALASASSLVPGLMLEAEVDSTTAIGE